MFQSLRERLARSKWPNANVLAQEIMAWAGGTDEVEIDAPLKLVQQGNRTPLSFRMNQVSDAGDYGPPIVMGVAGGDVQPTPALPAGTFTMGGGTYVAEGMVVNPDNAPTFLDYFPPEFDDPAAVNPGVNTDDPVEVGGSGGGVGLYGEVVAKVSARVFTVSYTPADGGDAVTATFEMPTLADAADLPAGTAVTVFLYPGRRRFIVPVYV